LHIIGVYYFETLASLDKFLLPVPVFKKEDIIMIVADKLQYPIFYAREIVVV
jgi:hypothetical protein